MAARYRRVAQSEDTDSEEIKKKRADRIERITAKLHAVFWIVTAVCVIFYTDLFNLALNDDNVNRCILNLIFRFV